MLLFSLSCEVHKVHKVKKIPMVKMFKCSNALCSWCCSGSFLSSLLWGSGRLIFLHWEFQTFLEKSWYNVNIANSVQYHFFLSFQKHYHEFSNNSLVLKCSLVNVNDLTLARQRELLTVTWQLKPYLVDVTEISAVGVDFFPWVGQSFHDANSSCWCQWQWLWQWWRQCWPGAQVTTWQGL